EAGQGVVGGFTQRFARGGFGGGDGVGVFDESTQVRVVVVAERGFHGDRFLGDLADLAHLVFRHLHAFGQLFGCGFTTDLLAHLPGDTVELVDRFDHVHRNANGARLIGDRTGDGLANPPGGVGGELVAAAVLEFVHRFHQADVAFL